jgi:hypothetical protein
MSSTPPQALSKFTPLRDGFSEAIAPGDRIVTLSSGAGATWWDGDTPVTAELPPGTRVAGARWTPDGKALRVGLGTLDVGARAWHAEPTLASWNQPGPRGDLPVREAAWFTDTKHVALLIESRAPDGARSTEIAIVSAADGRLRGRVAVEGASALVATQDRLLVASKKPVVLDLDAKVIAEPALPPSLTRVREGSGTFAAVGAAGAVALVDPASGAVVATWDANAIDAVPVPRGVVVVDLAGNVRVGCTSGNAIKNVFEIASGVPGAVIQLVGDRIVVAGGGPEPVRAARFTNPCP